MHIAVHPRAMQAVMLYAVVLLCSAGQSSLCVAEGLSTDHVNKDTYAAYLDVLRNPQLLASAKTYQTLMAHKHSLSRGQLQRSLVYKGANIRLRRVLNKLLAGQDVSVGVIGGSISWGHMVQKGVEDWFTLFSYWLKSTFPQAKLSFKNGCVPATQSEYVSMCLNQFVDANVDLVFVEYATNDGYFDGSINNSPVASFERLLRKLLHFKNAPAVCLMEFLATDAMKNKIPFYATAEDQYGVLAQYYGLPWMSYRDVVWQGLMNDQPGFRRTEIFPEEEERHPTPLGHKYMADIAVNLLQQTYMDSLLAPMDEKTLQDHPLAQVPAPLFPGNYESNNLVCIIGEELPPIVVQNNGWNWTNEGTAAKPKWGFVSWQVGAVLVLRVDTRASSASGDYSVTAAAATGSRSISGQTADTAAMAAGAEVTSSPNMFNMNSSSSSSNSSSDASDAPSMIIWVGYLKSWRYMGSASISCIKGCSCQALAVDAMHDLPNTQQHMVKLFATQARECLVEVKINPWARKKTHKFKVTGVMVTRRVAYSTLGDYTDSVLMDAMAPSGDDDDLV